MDYDGKVKAARREAAYHEAGHTVAAIKSPGGQVLSIDISNTPEVSDDQRGHTHCRIVGADEAFIIYAGSWAQASLVWPDETLDLDRVLALMRWNTDDWKAFQEVVGRRVTDRDVLELQSSVESGGVVPPEYRPDAEWHKKVADVLGPAASEIEQLAEELLNDEEHQLELTNGQLMVRDPAKADRWLPSESPKEVDSDGDGIVGPPPEIRQRY